MGIGLELQLDPRLYPDIHLDAHVDLPQGRRGGVDSQAHVGLYVQVGAAHPVKLDPELRPGVDLEVGVDAAGGGSPLEGEALVRLGSPAGAVVRRAGVHASLLGDPEGDPRRDRAVHSRVHLQVGDEDHRDGADLDVDRGEFVLDDLLLVLDVLGDGGGGPDVHRLLHGKSEVHALQVHVGEDVAAVQEVVQGGPVHVDVHVEVALEGQPDLPVEEDEVGIRPQLDVVEVVGERQLHVGGIRKVASL